MKQYVNLHNHTTYSMLDGHGQIEKYVARAKELGQPGLAITDHGNIHGWLDHYEKSMEYGVKPILGMEGYQARKTRHDQDEEERAGRANDELEQRGPYHITLLAKNNTGYRNLIKLSSRSYMEGYYVKPRMDHEIIQDHADGLIVLSGCLNGEVNQAILRGNPEAALGKAIMMQDIVGKENYFIEVHNHGLEEQRAVIPYLIEISKAIGAPMVASGDCHYVAKEDAHNHDVMLCVSTGSKMADEHRFKFFGPEFYLKSYDEMAVLLEPEWLDNTMLVHEMVDINLSFDEYFFPSFPKLPENHTTSSYFEKLVDEGIRNRYGDSPSQRVRDQLAHEMRVIKEMGFESYFLVVADLVNWAKDNGIGVGSGRGSAAGSIVSYALRITNIEPIRFDLLFERFLVEGRKTMPDIDIDIADADRGRVIEYSRQTYGDERVAHIVTFTQEGARSAIRDATRVLGYEPQIGDRLSKLLPAPVLGVTQSIEESLESTEELRDAYFGEPQSKEIIEAAKGLEGVHRQTGVHAAGVVIARSDITDYIPVMQKGDGEVITTQWDMDRVEQCGLLKIDFLGLRNLTVVQNCYRILRKTRDIDINLDETQEYEDPLAYELLCRGETTGVFQLESGPMKQMAMALQPTDINDIMALISLYRPGPLGSGMDKKYINRKHGREKVTTYHEAVKDLMEPTYGLMIYQEQVIKLAQILAGFSAGDADDLRRDIGKKKMDKIALHREAFVQGCKDTVGMKAALADKIYSDIEFFGGYGFNKSHAISYGVLSYQTAYLKAHYPAEYMAALLTSVANKKERLYPYLDECRRMGIEVLPPSVKLSHEDFAVKDGNIVFGLSAIDGVGDKVTEKLIEDREKYGESHNFYEFMRNSSIGILDKRSIEKLLTAGALDDVVEATAEPTEADTLRMLTDEQKQIGIFVTGHPLEANWERYRSSISHTLSELEEVADGKVVDVVGVVTGFTKRKTKSGNQMFRLRIEDLTGMFDVLIFGKTIKSANLTPEDFKIGTAIKMVARVKRDEFMDQQETTLFYISHEQLMAVEVEDNSYAIEVTDTIKKAWIFNQINDILKDNKGDIPVMLTVKDGDQVYGFVTKDRTTKQGLKAIESIVKGE